MKASISKKAIKRNARLHCSTESDGSNFAWIERLACAFAVRFEQFGELFVKLVQFRRDHHLAIGLVGIVRVILLMVALSVIEVGQRFQSSHDRFVKSTGGF
jgi:hypothetical protein